MVAARPLIALPTAATSRTPACAPGAGTDAAATTTAHSARIAAASRAASLGAPVVHAAVSAVTHRERGEGQDDGMAGGAPRRLRGDGHRGQRREARERGHDSARVIGIAAAPRDGDCDGGEERRPAPRRAARGHPYAALCLLHAGLLRRPGCGLLRLERRPLRVVVRRVDVERRDLRLDRVHGLRVRVLAGLLGLRLLGDLGLGGGEPALGGLQARGLLGAGLLGARLLGDVVGRRRAAALRLGQLVGGRVVLVARRPVLRVGRLLRHRPAVGVDLVVRRRPSRRGGGQHEPADDQHGRQGTPILPDDGDLLGCPWKDPPPRLGAEARPYHRSRNPGDLIFRSCGLVVDRRPWSRTARSAGTSPAAISSGRCSKASRRRTCGTRTRCSTAPRRSWRAATMASFASSGAPSTVSTTS